MAIGSVPPESTGGSEGIVYVEPDRLVQQAGQLADLGDVLRDHTAGQPGPARLGTAPPAVWFAGRLAALSGVDGAAGMILSWAQGLASMGESQLAAVTSYRESDEAGAADLAGIDEAGADR